MLEQLDPRPDGLIVASPCNPAGTMLHADELRAIAIWCDRNGVRLISDEIYHGLAYDHPVASAARSLSACGSHRYRGWSKASGSRSWPSRPGWGRARVARGRRTQSFDIGHDSPALWFGKLRPDRHSAPYNSVGQ